MDEESEIGVIAYNSKTFKGAAYNYFTTQKELLVIVWCSKNFVSIY